MQASTDLMSQATADKKFTLWDPRQTELDQVSELIKNDLFIPDSLKNMKNASRPTVNLEP